MLNEDEFFKIYVNKHYIEFALIRCASNNSTYRKVAYTVKLEDYYNIRDCNTMMYLEMVLLYLQKKA